MLYCIKKDSCHCGVVLFDWPETPRLQLRGTRRQAAASGGELDHWNRRAGLDRQPGVQLQQLVPGTARLPVVVISATVPTPHVC